MSHKALNAKRLIFFRSARRHGYWLDKPVGDNLLRELYGLMKWGSTGANCTPARLVSYACRQPRGALNPVLPAET